MITYDKSVSNLLLEKKFNIMNLFGRLMDMNLEMDCIPANLENMDDKIREMTEYHSDDVDGTFFTLDTEGDFSLLYVNTSPENFKKLINERYINDTVKV